MKQIHSPNSFPTIQFYRKIINTLLTPCKVYVNLRYNGTCLSGVKAERQLDVSAQKSEQYY